MFHSQLLHQLINVEEIHKLTTYTGLEKVEVKQSCRLTVDMIQKVNFVPCSNAVLLHN